MDFLRDGRARAGRSYKTFWPLLSPPLLSRDDPDLLQANAAVAPSVCVCVCCDVATAAAAVTLLLSGLWAF